MLLHLLRERKTLWLLVFNILLGILESVMTLCQIGYVKEVFDCAANRERTSLITALVVLGILILATTAIRNAVVYCHDLFTVRFRNRLSVSLFGKYLSSEHLGVKELHSGDVMGRVVQDIGSITIFFSDTLPRIISNVVLLLGAFIYLCFINYKIALCIIIVSPLFLIASKWFLRKSDYYVQGVRKAETQAQTLLQEVIQNKLVIKINRTVEYVIRQYTALADHVETAVANRTWYTVKMSFLLSTGLSAGYMITLGWGSLLLLDGLITLGDMAALLQLTDRIQNPARSLSDLIPQYAGFLVAKKRVLAIQQMNPEVGDTMELAPPLGICFENVTFSYPSTDKAVLRNFSFSFKPNSFTVIKGESGVGKTTMVNLILAVYKPDGGSIYVSDANRKYPITPSIRDYVEYVPQGNNLLSGTVEDNLKLGNPDADMSEMEEALHVACADFVLNSRDGLSTRCAEKGVGLSEGQSQRILIARALLRKRPILILDEATSALDEKTERALMNNLMSMTSKTIIFITHRKHLENIGDTILTL